MKAWTDLQAISIPECMQHLERDARGYPIPYNVTRNRKGKPDFRVIDPNKWNECVVFRKCALTGLPLGEEFAFVGGPQSMLHRLFTDAAMLPEAAEYAIQVCPFLAAPSFSYATVKNGKLGGEGVTVFEGMSTERPEVFAIGITRSYSLYRHGSGLVIQAGPWESLKRYRHGKPSQLNWKPTK